MSKELGKGNSDASMWGADTPLAETQAQTPQPRPTMDDEGSYAHPETVHLDESTQRDFGSSAIPPLVYWGPSRSGNAKRAGELEMPEDLTYGI